jgi:aspartate-semialdehyde dehydrogenase
VAFDCISGARELDSDGSTRREAAMIEILGLLLGKDVKLATTFVQVPAFVGLGASLFIETRKEIEASEAAALLQKAPGVEIWPDEQPCPSTRSVAGQDRVLVGRLRRNPGVYRGLQLWLVADPVRLAASHAIQLAAMRLR